MRYETLAAFRQALDRRLADEGRRLGVDPQRLRRRVVFERFLVRLEQADPGRWVLKDGTLLEVRLGNRARATKDLDLVAKETGGTVAIVPYSVGSLGTTDYFSYMDAIVNGFKKALQ